MKIAGKHLEQKTVEALKGCLENVPFVKGMSIISEPDRVDMKPDLVARVNLPDGEEMGSSSNANPWDNHE